jgi:hypothetical protein
MRLNNRVNEPRTSEQCVALGHKLSQAGRFVEAEVSFRNAIELNPDRPMPYNNLGWVRQMQGDNDVAVTNYQKALHLDPNLRIARRNLATLLIRLGQRKNSLYLWHKEMLDKQGLDWMHELIKTSMQARDLSLAGEYASIVSEFRWGSQWYPSRCDNSIPSLPVQTPKLFLTIPKLAHDIEQFQYLQNHGVLGNEFTQIVREYQRVIDRLTPLGNNVRVPLEKEDQQNIGHVYNRIVHVRHTPRMKQALSGKWDSIAVETQYISPPGVVVVDDFLSNEALESLRLFCLESTVWSANRYAHGRFGAFFQDGFNCPLLLQIAEELREAMPHVIGDRYPLRQVWGFKNGHMLPGDSTTHADFAAVNVNFWITPDEANLDKTSGGLVIYDVDAPLEWDFDTYNGRSDIIKPFLQQQQARTLTIPYRQNRAVIFNSDLFHGTAQLNFKPGYENRRVNITMLYGDRENEVHHPQMMHPNPATAWRSASFARVRASR